MQPLTSFLALGVFAGLSSAQYYINPTTVPIGTRDNWCYSQTTSCPLICLQYPNATGAEVNTCNATSLSYECLCSNGLVPNSSEYSQTLPYYVCQEWGTQCVAGCGNDNTCAYNCRANHPCGAQNPTRVNLTTATASQASTSEAPSASAFGSGDSSSTSKGAAPRLRPTYSPMGNTLGYLVVAAGLVGGFAFLL